MHAHKLERAIFSDLAPAPRQGFATVIAREGGTWQLDVPGADRPVGAGRATSCLVEPGVGDRVWFVGEGDEHFVIAVIAPGPRSTGETGERSTAICVDGDLDLRAGGRVRVDGERVELDARAALSLRSRDELAIEARRGRVVLDSLASFVRSVRAHLSESTLVGKVRELIVERFTQHSNTSYRAVGELDHVRAGTLDYKAERGAHIHGENTSMSATELVKVDAGQIHLG